MNSHTTQRKIIPDSETIAALPVFPLLGLGQVDCVRTGAEAERARTALMAAPTWGFDTESKPTFRVGEVSDGPHVVQLAIEGHAWVFLLHDPACVEVVAQLLATPILKAGFGLGDDCKRVRIRLGVDMPNVLELNQSMRQLGYRSEMGVKASVAVLFGQRFAKSKKVSTSNWAQPELSPSQLLYAANDAYAAWCVWRQLAA